MDEPIRWPVATVIMAAMPTVALLAWWPFAIVGIAAPYLVLLVAAIAASVLLSRPRRGPLAPSVGAGLAAGLGAIVSVFVLFAPALALGTVLGGGSV